MQQLAELLAATGLVNFVNSSAWVWPICEMLHFIGMSVLIGTIGLVDLRILGIAKGLPIRLLEKLVPYGIAAFVLNLLTGFIFIAGNPSGGPMFYLDNLSFQLKMLCVLIAGVNVLLFYFTGISAAADDTPSGGNAPAAAKVVAVTSLILWFGVIFFGRMLMYNDTLLNALGL